MRGEGNHKIPGSFAPENMEKTGAERVKYSLACQHEDAIPIKFVPYAQKCPTVLCTFAVALRKESVDRNTRCASHRFSVPLSLSARRAWIEIIHKFFKSTMLKSLSARRAWIEMQGLFVLGLAFYVALRKESVDRNIDSLTELFPILLSLSARRAWIEILALLTLRSTTGQSLSARRAWIEMCFSRSPFAMSRCRSPQGERG